MAQVKTQLVIDGKNNSKKAFDEVNSQLNSMNKQLATAGKALIGVFSVSALTGAVRGIASAADSYNLMNARLKLATESQGEFNTAQTELRRIAAATAAFRSLGLLMVGWLGRLPACSHPLCLALKTGARPRSLMVATS